MKTFTFIIDIGFTFFLIFLAIRLENILYLIPVLLMILNISCIASQKLSQGWFFLYLKRKALEEQKKIDDLSSK